MATATLNNPVTSNAGSAGKTTTERFDIAFGYELGKDKDGKVTKEATTMSPEKAAELEKEGKFEGSVVTVSCDYPTTWDGLKDYENREYKDDEGKPRDKQEVLNDLVKLFVNGAKNKVANRMRAQLTKVDKDGNLTFSEQDAPGGILDLTGEITSGSKRVFLSEEQKTWRSLENLPAAIRQSMFDVYLKSIGKESYTPQE